CLARQHSVERAMDGPRTPDEPPRRQLRGVRRPGDGHGVLPTPGAPTVGSGGGGLEGSNVLASCACSIDRVSPQGRRSSEIGSCGRGAATRRRSTVSGRRGDGMRVRDIMSHPVLAVPESTTVKEAADLLSRRGFTAMPVVDEQERIIGIVTEADLLREQFPRDPRYRTPEDDAREAPPKKVGEVMTAPPVVCSSTMDVAQLAEMMVREHRRCVPIVDDDRLVGIVTRRDLLRVLRRTDREIAADLRRHLAMLGGPGRYTVSVREGEAIVIDQFDDPQDRHIAQVVAEAVPGVTGAKVISAPHCPRPQ